MVALAVAGVVAWSVIARVGDPSVSLPMTGSDPSTATTSGRAATTTTPAAVVVHVAGAVVSPGVVRLTPGTRVADALAAAGGVRSNADMDRVNLAAPLNDGGRIYVPAVGQEAVPQPVGLDGSGDASAVPGRSGPVDLNSATVEQLETLPGVGPSTAAAIVAHRESNGPFSSIEELDEVRGIGPARLEQLRDLVVVP